MRSKISSLLTFTLLVVVSARGVDIHIDLDSSPPISTRIHTQHEVPNLGIQQVPDHYATLNFDSLTPGAPAGAHGHLTWTPSIRVVDATNIASSPPNALLISQYNADEKLTHPSFCIDNRTATFKTFDLLSFFIAPVYEPKTVPRIDFNVSVIGAGPEEGRVVSRMVTVSGPKWPQKVVLEGFEAVATVTVEMTSQIAQTGGPFMPLFVIDDVDMYWRRVEGGGGDGN